MKRKVLSIICLSLLVLVSILNIESNAKTILNIKMNKEEINVGEELDLTIENSDISAAACTIWIYFDNEKLECLTKLDNLNVINNRIIYTWISENGYNTELTNFLNLKFKAKTAGIASFTIITEMYDENGKEIEVDSSATAEIKIIEENSQKQTKNNVSNSLDLDIMRLDIEGIVPNFSPDITEYYIVVDEDIEKINVTAISESDNANIKIDGNNNLKNGINKIIITVSIGDNTKKYNINVTKTDQKEKANTNLEALAVENYEISPEYKENITMYDLEISNTEEKLNILAIPEDMKANVEIKNNENLQYGENAIEILVTAENEITKRTYILNVYKRNEEEEKAYKENEQNIINESNALIEKISSSDDGYIDKNEQDIKEVNETKELQNNIIMWVGIILSIVVIIIVIIRIKKEKKKSKYINNIY